MQTRTYADLYETIEALCGVTLASNEAAKIRALVNRRATKAYRASNYWPRYLTVGEERTLTGSVIPYDEDGLSTIDTFLLVHRGAPFLTKDEQELAFTVGPTGATIIQGNLALTSVWVTYKATHDAIYGTNGTDTTDVPKEWFDYLAHGAYADFLRGEGQQEKAALADAEASDILTDELLRIDEQGTTQVIATRINTNLSNQTR